MNRNPGNEALPGGRLTRSGKPGRRGALYLIFLLLLPLPGVAEIVVIANPSVPVDQLDRNAARLIFSMRRSQWPDGTPMRVVVMPDDHPLHRAFCSEVLHLYPRQLRRVWDRQTYSGTGQSPETVATPEEMLERVATRPGAVGYLPREKVDRRVKLLEVKP